MVIPKTKKLLAGVIVAKFANTLNTHTRAIYYIAASDPLPKVTMDDLQTYLISLDCVLKPLRV